MCVCVSERWGRKGGLGRVTLSWTLKRLSFFYLQEGRESLGCSFRREQRSDSKIHIHLSLCMRLRWMGVIKKIMTPPSGPTEPRIACTAGDGEKEAVEGDWEKAGWTRSLEQTGLLWKKHFSSHIFSFIMGVSECSRVGLHSRSIVGQAFAAHMHITCEQYKLKIGEQQIAFR